MSRFVREHATAIVLAFILLIALVARFYEIDGQSFWADEGNSVVLGGQSMIEIIKAAAADIHPPIYYILLKIWGTFSGLNEIGARSLSAVLGLATVWVIYLIGSSSSSRAVGLIAALLAAVNPFLIYYSQEARMYALLALCASLTALATLLFLRGSARLRVSIFYTFFAAIGLYTHYAFPIHLLTLNVFVFLWLLQLRKGPRAASSRAYPGAGISDPASTDASTVSLRTSRTWRSDLLQWLSLQIIVLLLFVPWSPTALRQLSNWPSPSQTLTFAEAVKATTSLFVCGPIPCPQAPVMTLLTLVSLGLFIVSFIPTATWRQRKLPPPLLPSLWFFMPLLGMFAFGIFTPVFSKFLVIAVPAYVLILAQGLETVITSLNGANITTSSHRFSISTLRAIVLVAVMLALLYPNMLLLNRYYHDPTVARDDYRSIAAYVKSVATADDAIILNAPGQKDVFSQYDPGPIAIYPLPKARPLDPVATVAQLEQLLANHDTIYAIYWATTQADPDAVIETFLAKNAYKAWDTWIGNLRFAAYRAAQPFAITPIPNPPEFGTSISLDGVGLERDRVIPGEIVPVTLVWIPEASVPQSLKVSLQLLDPANQIVAQVDSEPVGGARATTTWQPYEVISDPYGLAIPLATPPGSYALVLAMYDAQTGIRLPVTTAEAISDHYPLGAVTIEVPEKAPPLAILPMRFRHPTTMGPFTLLGHDRYKQGFGHAPDTKLAPGDHLHVTLYWMANVKPSGDFSFELQLDGKGLARFELAGPDYPSSEWTPGFPWRGEHSVQLPADLATGRHHELTIQLLDPEQRPVGAALPLKPLLLY